MRGIDYWVGGKQMMEMTASHLMEKDVVSFERETTGHELAEMMFEGNYGRHPGGFGSIPIVDNEKRLIGIVSEFDILNALREGKDLYRITASELMTKPAVSIHEEMLVEDVIELLQKKHFIRVPVVDDESRLIGILARREILGSYLESITGGLPCF